MCDEEKKDKEKNLTFHYLKNNIYKQKMSIATARFSYLPHYLLNFQPLTQIGPTEIRTDNHWTDRPGTLPLDQPDINNKGRQISLM